MDYTLLKVLHILSATVLFGTGLGTAFQMWRAHGTGDVATIAHVARNVALADTIFTTPAVFIQPASGVALALLAGHDLFTSWLIVTYLLYLLAGACWLPVVWLQIRMRDVAQAARDNQQPLPPAYFRAFRLWFTLGWPAFSAVIVIVWLMVAKPALW